MFLGGGHSGFMPAPWPCYSLSSKNNVAHFPVSSLSCTEQRPKAREERKLLLSEELGGSRIIQYHRIHSRQTFQSPPGRAWLSNATQPLGNYQLGGPVAPISLMLNKYKCQKFITTRRPKDCRAMICHMVLVAGLHSTF